MQTELSFPPFGTDIPYFEEGDDPATKHEYVDLRANPEAIATLPEVALAPALGPALLRLNGPDTPLRTFGCDFALDRGDFGEGFTHLAHSYIHLGFAEPARCRDRDAYFILFGRLAARLHEGDDLVATEVERFFLDYRMEALRLSGEWAGWIANLSCDVLASSESEALEDWARLLDAITSYLAAEHLD